MKKLINYVKNLYEEKKEEIEYFALPIFLALILLSIYFLEYLDDYQ